MRQKPSTLPAHTYRRLSPKYSLLSVKVLLSGDRARASRWVWHKTVFIARVQTSDPGKGDINSSLSLYT